jgi:hypothetical protein
MEEEEEEEEVVIDNLNQKTVSFFVFVLKLRKAAICILA